MNKVRELFLGLVGSVLKNVIIELYRYDGDPDITINDVQLDVGNSKFILACSGDGSVLVKEGQAILSDYNEGIANSKLYALESVSECTIDNIEIKDASVVINLGDSKLEIVNDDDELVIISNGNKLFFDAVV